MMRSDLASGRQGAQRVVNLLQQIFKVRQVDLAVGLQALQPLTGLGRTPHQGSLNQWTKPPAVTFPTGGNLDKILRQIGGGGGGVLQGGKGWERGLQRVECRLQRSALHKMFSARGALDTRPLSSPTEDTVFLCLSGALPICLQNSVARLDCILCELLTAIERLTFPSSGHTLRGGSTLCWLASWQPSALHSSACHCHPCQLLQTSPAARMHICTIHTALQSP